MRQLCTDVSFADLGDPLQNREVSLLVTRHDLQRQLDIAVQRVHGRDIAHLAMCEAVVKVIWQL